jgi:hypothetical protein
MTPLLPAQRAAEEFDQVLGGTASKASADRYSELLEAVEALRAQPELVPRTEFVGDLRSRLMTAAETELVAAPSVVRHLEPARTRRRNRRIGTIAASLVIVGGSAGMAAAASGALPGEPLYPIKRGIEQVDTAVRLSDVSKGEALLNQAATRLEEAQAIQAQGSPEPALIAETIDSFQDAAGEGSDKLFSAYQAGGDTQDINTVRSFTSKQMAGIVAMSADNLDSKTNGLLVDAADTLADIDQQARVLCGGCGPETTLEPPAALSAGAGAATLDNLLARPVSQAQVDVNQVEAARIAHLKAVAEKAAGKIPKITDVEGTDSAASILASGPGDRPVRSTITSDGRLIPAVTTGVAVNDLVSGVTGTVKDVTGGKVTHSKTPLDDTVKDLTGTVDGATDGLRP